MLDPNKYEVINMGEGGSTALKSSDKPYMTVSKYREALESEPDIVLLMFGFNDSKKSIWDGNRFMIDYHRLIRSFENLPSTPKIYLMIPPPLYLDTYRDM